MTLTLREPERCRKRQEAGRPWFPRRPWCRTARDSNPSRIDLWGRRKGKHVKMKIWRWNEGEKERRWNMQRSCKKAKELRIGEKLKKTSESRFMFPSLPMVILRRYPSLVSMTHRQVIEAGSMSMVQWAKRLTSLSFNALPSLYVIPSFTRRWKRSEGRWLWIIWISLLFKSF